LLPLAYVRMPRAEEQWSEPVDGPRRGDV